VADAQVELPVRAKGRNSVGWWGVMCLIATEASLFAYLLFSYGYMASQYGRTWSPEPHPSLSLSLPNTAILLSSSVSVWWGERGVKAGRRGQQLGGLALGMALGAAFVVVQLFEWKAKSFGPTSSSYGSLYFIITGFHMAHVIAGLGVLATIFGWSAARYFDRRHHGPVLVASAYWHFVDAVWIAVFFTFYVSPYLG
jgi:heme/copper-type cytochrome/quinol oxidase subunit 3